MITATDILEAALLVTALSIDAFVVSFGYGVNHIKIPFLSAQVINVTCSALLAAAIFLGVAARAVIPEPVSAGISFAILFLLGVLRLFDSAIKRRIRTAGIEKELRFRLSSLSFILQIYASPEEADRDRSRVLSPGEAVSLAVALSLDSLTVGFGAGLVSAHPVMVVLFSLVSDFAAVMLGCQLGRKVAQKLKFDISWVSGAMLIGLALMKLF